jgi:methylamine dehydrogenase accessory protein MauD
MDALTVSVVLLWLAVIALGVMLWALSRQVGVLFERVAPMGALVTDAGPAVGEAVTELPAARHPVRGGAPSAGRGARHAAVLPVAHLPGVQEAAAGAEGAGARRKPPAAVVLASDGEPPSTCASSSSKGLQAMPYVLSTELGMGYRVSRLPYAVLLDRQGVVAAKGLVNSREQLDSLLNAHDMGTPTIQQYLDGNAA